MLGGYSLTKIVSSPLVGHASDVYGRKPLLVVMLVGSGVCLAVTAQTTSVEGLIAARMVTGVFASNGALLTAILYEAYPSSAVRMLSLLETCWKVAYFAAPAILYALADWPPSTPLVLAAALFFIAALLATGLRVGDQPASKGKAAVSAPFDQEAPPATRAFGDAMRTSLAHPLVLALIVAGIVSPTKDMAPLMASKFGSGPAEVSATSTVKYLVSLGVTISPMAANVAKTYPVRQVILGGLVVQGILFCIYPLAPTLWAFYALHAVAAVVAAVSDPIEIAYVSSLATKDTLGAFIGVTHSIKGITRFSSTLLGAMLSGSAVEAPFYIGGAGLAAKGMLVAALGR